MAQELVTMSAKELDRLEVIQRVVELQLPQVKAADLLGLTARQVRRLCRAYEGSGPGGLASRRRGRPSNRRLPEELQARVVALVRDHYADFGPMLAREKLLERHDLHVGRETLRKWMSAAGIWLPRRKRIRHAHQPRHRRSCLGELVQIDGCDHEWFEERAPRCALLVYVDDATGNLMELRFVEAESAFDYFAATRAYLARHGRPVERCDPVRRSWRITTGRFGRPPRDPHDAHRPLRGDEDLDHIFAWQEDRRMSANLTVHFRRRAYLVTPTPETLPLGGKTVRVHEWEDGRVELRCEGRVLPYSLFDKNPIVSQGSIVENKRLGAVLAVIQANQTQRDHARLASRKLSLREKERLRQARARAEVPIVENSPKPRNRTSLLGREADISTWV